MSYRGVQRTPGELLPSAEDVVDAEPPDEEAEAEADVSEEGVLASKALPSALGSSAWGLSSSGHRVAASEAVATMPAV